jgi:hypothetical protein
LETLYQTNRLQLMELVRGTTCGTGHNSVLRL